MVIRAIDFVKQCATNEDGDIIYHVVEPHLRRDERVTVSFEGIDAVSTSFINTAFITLLDQFSFPFIKKHLGFTDTNSQINDVIRSRFQFEASRA